MPRSLAFRLVASAALVSIAVLAVGGALLSSIFRDSLQDDFDTRLSLLLESLVATTEMTDGVVSLQRPLADPRFDQVYSGWYWQIDGPDGVRQRSRSLFDQDLQAPDGNAVATGPDGERLRVVRRQILLPGADEPLTFMLGARTRELDEQARRFGLVLTWSLGLLALGLIVAVVVQVRYGLRPLGQISATLARIRDGQAARLDGPFPAEVRPLAAEVNELLTHSETVVARARTHVGNLAHALKTPLTVLANEASSRHDDLSTTVRAQTAAMRRQIDHYLVRARTAATGDLLTARTEVRPVIAGLLRTLRRIYQDRRLTLSETVSNGLAFRGEKEDLEEIAGNLLDNACKWARRQVLVTADIEAGYVRIEVHDDGPGLPDDARAAALQRGTRLDETVQGSGLGLSIVRDIAGLYGGELRLDESARLGGLNATVRLPNAGRR